jgi:hypothetical protein
MKNYLILILAAMAVAGLGACSGGDQGDQKSSEGAAVAEHAAKPADMVPATDVQVDETPNLKRSRAAVAKLGKELKAALQEAMGEGGPMAAIAVCHDEAAVIASRIREEEGLIVGRTSVKFRNPDNAPDLWELAGLAALQSRLDAGEKPKDLEMWDTVSGADGKRTFRYLKAIPTAPLCLQCHGAELDPTLAGKLAELYPEDKATGFEMGDLRGAFTVKIELPSS